VLTPRRFLLFIAALGGFAVAYLVYSQALGAVDGLPALPNRYLTEASGQPVIVNPPVPPIDEWLTKAFGPNAVEVTDTRDTYKTRFRKRDSGLAVACGGVDPNGTPFVTVSPISLALFGRPSTQPKPGEVDDISTFHADKAVLEFDRPVSNLQELNDKATLVSIKLIADPDLETKVPDERRGRIWITSNQKSANPADLLLIRTVGPLFYEVPPESAPHDPEKAQVWTAAPVEVFDRKTLPRPLHVTAPRSITTPTAALPRPDDLRKQGAVADILHGLTLPPPTVVAEGLKLYLLPEKDNKRGGVGYSGVRELRLVEKVQMNLWVEGGGGLPGTGTVTKPAPKDAKELAAKPIDPALDAMRMNPTQALTAAFGGGLDGIAIAERLARKSLLLVETPGPFRYSLEEAVATFDVAPHAPANGPNVVSVTRLPADGPSDNLFCSRLRLDLTRPNDGAASADKKDGKAEKPVAADTRDGGLSLRKLTATGPRVYIAVASEQFTAQGTELTHEQDPLTKVTTTTLIGSPVFADRANSQLRAGDATKPGRVEIVSTDAPPGAKPGRRSAVTVRGPGEVKMFDAEAGRSTGQASWGTRLVQEKVTLGDLELDRLTFEGGGTFADIEGDMRLSADKLRLWLTERTAAPKPAGAKADRAPAIVPHSLIGDGNVDAKSPDMIVRHTDKLTVWFRDIPPPKPEPVAPAPPPPVVAAKPEPVVGPRLPAPPGPPKIEPVPEVAPLQPAQPPPNPIHLSARVVETWVTRYPLPPTPPDQAKLRPAGRPAGQSGLKYELERARCEDRVVVHQDPDPTDPAKPPTGLDIVSATLNLDQSSRGGLLTVTGTPTDPAEVTFEDTKIFGPTVVIDQPNNAVRVAGRGKLKMLGGADLTNTGGDPARPSNLDVTWATSMRFQGAKSFAEFVGTVVATQLTNSAPPPVGRPAAKGAEAIPTTTRATLMGHRLDLTFDRPVYFNQTRRADRNRPAGNGRAERPKVRTVAVTTIPDDEIRQAADKLRKEVMFVEEVFDAANKNRYVRARVLRAGQIDLAIRDKDLDLLASGPGELRLMQPPENAKPEDKKETKLTVVTFGSRMVGRDRGGVYREAKFDGYSRVAQIPTDKLTFDVRWHALPAEANRLECDDLLTVSSTQASKDGPVTQRMTAVGNAQFRNKDYRGFGGTIADDGDKIIFDGTRARPAQMYSTKSAVNDRPSHTAEQIQYHRDGSISTKGSSGGTIITNPGR